MVTKLWVPPTVPTSNMQSGIHHSRFFLIRFQVTQRQAAALDVEMVSIGFYFQLY